MSDKPARLTKLSKIVKYKLEEDTVNLRYSGLSYQQIADQLNASGKVPKEDPIDKWTVMRFLDRFSDVQKEVIRENKQRLVKVVNNSIDIAQEASSIFSKTKQLLEEMEEDARENGKLVNPYQFKAVASELRELLKFMTDVQKELIDYSNVRKFIEIVINAVREECPEKLPAIVDRLKAAKTSGLISDIVNEGNE
ncbi:MAG: hypothetical protein QJR05_04515 [Thermoanaerobacterium sp.]|nr:hypothetical protein [Thermoanaerobacterium sp.]